MSEGTTHFGSGFSTDFNATSPGMTTTATPFFATATRIARSRILRQLVRWLTSSA